MLVNQAPLRWLAWGDTGQTYAREITLAFDALEHTTDHVADAILTPLVPIAVYCVKCGGILPNEQLSGLDRILAEPEFMKRLINSESFKDALRKALGEKEVG